MLFLIGLLVVVIGFACMCAGSDIQRDEGHRRRLKEFYENQKNNPQPKIIPIERDWDPRWEPGQNWRID